MLPRQLSPYIKSQRNALAFSPLSKTETSFAAIKARRQRREAPRGQGAGQRRRSPASPHGTARAGAPRPLVTTSDLRREKCTFPRSRCRADVPCKHPVSFQYNMPHSSNYLLGELFGLPRGAAVSQSEMSSTCPAVPIRQLNLCKQNHLFPKRG